MSPDEAADEAARKTFEAKFRAEREWLVNFLDQIGLRNRAAPAPVDILELALITLPVTAPVAGTEKSVTPQQLMRILITQVQASRGEILRLQQEVVRLQEVEAALTERMRLMTN